MLSVKRLHARLPTTLEIASRFRDGRVFISNTIVYTFFTKLHDSVHEYGGRTKFDVKNYKIK